MRHAIFTPILCSFAALAALNACNNGQKAAIDSPAKAGLQSPAADDFISQLKVNYPVSLAEIGQGVWVYTTNYALPGQAPISSNGLAIADGDDLILVDTPWGELATLSLLETLKEKTGKTVTKLVVTHHHMDRLAGVDLAERQNIQVYSHPETPTLAAKKGYPVPNTSVAALNDAQSRTKIGPIEIAYPGHGHAVDNLVVYIGAEKILYGGCMIRRAGSTHLGNLEDANLKSWGPALAWVKSTYPETEIVVPGHGQGANLSLIDNTLALIAQAVNKAPDGNQDDNDTKDSE